MTFAECVERVRRRTQAVSSLEAIQVAHISLSVLADSLPGTLTEELSAILPSEWADAVRRPDWHPGERLTLSELLDRIAASEGTTSASARPHLGAVLETLREVLPESQMSRLLAELPEEVRELVGTNYPAPRMHQVAS